MRFDTSWIYSLPPGWVQVVVRMALALAAVLILWFARGLIERLLGAGARRLPGGPDAEWEALVRDVVHIPLRYLTLALALMIAAELLLNFQGRVLVGRVVGTLVVVAFAVTLVRLVARLTPSTSRLFRFTGITIQPQLLPFVRTALQVIIVALMVLLVAQQWLGNVSGLLAGLGLGGLAFSLAAQDTISNLFGFSAIVADRPMVVGEYIVTPDVEGVVERVGVRSTRVRTLDQSLVSVPNSRMAASTITNWSRLTRRRHDFRIGLTYKTRSNAMRALLADLRAMLGTHNKVDPDTITVRFVDFGSDALQVMVRCYSFTPDWNDWVAEREAINLDIMDLVHKHNLDFAFPTRTLQIENMPNMRADLPTPSAPPDDGDDGGFAGGPDGGAR